MPFEKAKAQTLCSESKCLSVEQVVRAGPSAARDRDGSKQMRGIDQRNEADPKRTVHFRSSDAVKIDCAISAIFFFSRIAVERIST